MLLNFLFYVEYARLSIWIEDGSSNHNNLIKYVLKKDTVKNVMILLCTDMSQPWDILETLEYWSSIVQQHIHSLQLSAKEMNEMERQSMCYFFDKNDCRTKNIGMDNRF